MKTKLVYLILILAAVGCKSTGERKLSKTQEYLRQRDACDRDENCSKEREQSLRIEAHPIAHEFAQTENLDKFSKEICGVEDSKFPNQASRSACSAKYQDAFAYRLVENYSGANIRTINVWCRAHPIDCRNPENLEQQYKESADAATTTAQTRQEEAEDQRKADRRRRIFQALGAGLRSAGESMKNSNVLCTSNRLGNTVYTNCN